MENIKLYTVSDKYIDYLSIYAPHLFYNKTHLIKQDIDIINVK